ncbi:ribonuclease P protein component [Rhodobacter sp. CZR27]|uniref:ribonuclease P protein component n=1 Tax=Rhodobacter sp. CZR27 TaxID=2033869 RepID=UPI000BBEA8D9|nr:ribonuclease P protein component [Rhodobacter sp. CZR27]
MMPPEAGGTGSDAASAGSPAVSSLPTLEILRKRADFLRAAQARRQGTPGFLLQARRRGDEGGIRVGFTCSKKVGNAVTRNRAKRRLRSLAREVLAGKGHPGWDYVLVGRPGATIERPYAALLSDLDRALGQIHGSGR